MNTNTSRVVSLIGAGIFICLSLQGISFLFSELIMDALLFTPMDPKVIYGIKAYGSITISVLIFLLFIKQLKKMDFQKPKTARNLFLVTIGTYGFTQVLGFLLPFARTFYEGPTFYHRLDQYLIAINQDFMSRMILIDYPTWFLQYFAIAFIVWRVSKSLSTTHMQE